MHQKLIIGIDQTTDIDALLSLGVRQFYFGYLPASFLERYSSQISINRRYRESEQFCDLTQLLKIISKIHQQDGIVYLALNAMSSNEKLLHYAKEVYELLHKDVDGVIVANITLATFLKKQNYPNIILSNLFGIYTPQSAEFFIRQFAPKKVILPRDISLKTISTIATQFPDTAFEVFLYGDNCRYSESFCFSEHGYDSIGMPSLCTFASQNKTPIAKPNPAYKQIVNNSTLLESDKKSSIEYQINIQSAKVLEKEKEQLFYSDKPLLQMIKGVYFGNSSCEHLLSSLKEIVEAYNTCKKRHWNFVYVFAPLSSFSFEFAKNILEFLNEKKASIVVNDFGVLQMVKQYEDITIILGINFTKVVKDTFIDTMTPTDTNNQQLSNQKELASHIEFENKDVREFYKDLGVGRFAVENLEFSLDFLNQKPKIQLDFYYPYVMIANSKACDIAGLYNDTQNYFVSENCAKHCLNSALEFENGDIFGLYQRYNSIYKTKMALNIPEIISKDDKNRLIWEIFL